MGKQYRVLVVDDEKLVCWSLGEMLTDNGYLVETALSGEEARSRFGSFNPHMVLLDVRLPDANGLNLLTEFKAKNEDLIVLMITAHADANSAVSALKEGAADYIGKPFNIDSIRYTVEKCFEQKKLRKEVDFLRREQRKKYDYDNLIGNSWKMIDVFKMIKICAETDAKIVLVLGESGTGKQLVSHAIHHHSARSDAPFIETNCAAIPENLLENELFGHEKGAFTDASASHQGIFEAAEGGTVFLDEIGDMPLAMQAKILKVIDSNTFRKLGGKQDIDVDVRIITATNQNLQKLVKESGFRQDLFYRLNVMSIVVPPLRERKEDIPPLANYFIERLNQEYGKSIKGISPEAEQCLINYDWPGNVRELRNALERAIMLEQDTVLTPRYLSKDITGASPAAKIGGAASQLDTAGDEADYEVRLPPGGISLEEVEKSLITQALDRYRGNQTKAARALKISRDTLRYRMKKFKLDEGEKE